MTDCESGVHLTISWLGAVTESTVWKRIVLDEAHRTESPSVASCSLAPVPGQVLFM